MKLMKILDCRGISSDEVEGYVIRQFCRGCRDDDLFLLLELPARSRGFSRLLWGVRVEEARKADRDKRFSSEGDSLKSAAKSRQKNDLQSQVMSLQKKVDDLSARSNEDGSVSVGVSGNTSVQKRDGTSDHAFCGFCFNCGIDGHISRSCHDDKNPVLVQEKLWSSKIRTKFSRGGNSRPN